MSKNHPKIYTKPQYIGECSKWSDLALLETWARYWHKGHVERHKNSLQVKPRLKSKIDALNTIRTRSSKKYELKYDKAENLMFAHLAYLTLW